MPVACKPKHDYQGLLGMGRGVVGVLMLVHSISPLHALGAVRAIEGRQEITFKSWHTEPQIP